MSSNSPQPPDPAVWEAQYLRLICFPAEPQYAVQQNWWQELTGAEREGVIQKRTEKTEEGIYRGASLSLSIDLLRLQWTVAPRIIPEIMPDTLPSLGSFLEQKASFKDLMNRWLAVSPRVRRLAFGGVLLHRVANKEEGYEMLDRYLRWVDINPQSSDFLYRINRPVPSNTSVPNLIVNRLTTWSVGKFAVLVRGQLAGMATQVAGEQTATTEANACVLELDINTVPEPPDRELPHEALPRIFDELVELGMDIATRGDVRP